MANLTLTIDEGLLRTARIRALERGTTVNAMVRDFLTRFAGNDEEWGRRAILAVAEKSKASSGPQGRTWTRDDVYDV